MTAVYTVAEVAHHLRCSTDTVYALIKRGELRAIPIGRGGRALRIPAVELGRFLEAPQAS